WVSPIFRNKWIHNWRGQPSASYHGYWITDFTDVDPHFGTKADFKRLVDAAHARGMKVYLDIVVNHTADVIRYRECPHAPCAYRSEAEYPYDRKGGVDGPPINQGFLGDDAAHQTDANFARLVSPDYAYTPYIPAGEAHIKKPDWLNDVRLYHNRGDMADADQQETKTHGDFGGLDDVMTENPRVVRGFIAVYERWIADFGVDGFRIDTERHVDPAFWRAFCPAILKFARAHGKPNFYIFGEVADPDPAMLARHTRVDKLPAVLDFAFQAAALDAIGGKTGTTRLARLFDADPDYVGGAAGAMQMATFIGNHDMGRFPDLLRARSPNMSRDELLKRTVLADALLLFSRGAPIIYYGQEQGLYGGGGDNEARQTMFPSQVAAYQAETPLGATRPGAPGYNEQAPIYRAIAEMTTLRNAHPGLRRGVQVVALTRHKPGLYVFTRTDPKDGQYLIALNTSTEPQVAYAPVDIGRTGWTSLHGACAPRSAAPGSLRVEVPALGYIVCRAAS
ncbi:MAG: alpha-amylase, partial [Alphaproteobacteria bacterium]|nr:alpha-amylase [Alphaproteobacteria bacterium]